MKMILFNVAHVIFCVIQGGVKELARDVPYILFEGGMYKEGLILYFQ